MSAAIDPTLPQRAASDPTASVWVGASAGTGKTKVLTDRVLRLMLAGTPTERILCLTFTKAAAAEMALRIGAVLADWAVLADQALAARLADLTGAVPDEASMLAARRLFARVVDCPGGMKILTIHAFCQSLLRRFPVEAGLAPRFEVMDERTTTEILNRARDAVLAAAEAEDAADGGALGRAVSLLTLRLQADGFDALMAHLTAERGRVRRLLDAHGGRDGLVAAIYRRLGIPPGLDADAVLADAVGHGACDDTALRLACRALAGGSPADQARGAGIQNWLDAPAANRIRDLDDYAGLFLTGAGTVRATLITKAAAAADPAALDALAAEAARIVAVRARLRTARTAEATTALVTIAAALLERYQALKQQRAVLDYDDLILAARGLLTEGGAAAWVLFKLDGGLDHILIDEAQDTNPDQWRVVEALAEEFFAGEGARAEARTVFAVGDEKQSIFSFQRADPAEFQRMRRHFADRVDAAGRPWRQIDLQVSFRSTAPVLRLVDAVFAAGPARDGVADGDVPIRHLAHRSGHGGLVELWPLVPQAEAAPIEPWQPLLDRQTAGDPAGRLAAVIAARIADWLARGEVLASRGRPVQPGDVLILVRKRGSFFDAMVRALKARGVPVAGVDRMVLDDQIAVMDLMALGRFLLLPEDDLTLAVVLKGPLIGLDEEQLFRLCHGRQGSLWSALAEGRDDPALAVAHDYLVDLLARTDFVAPYQLFAGILARPCPADAGGGRRALLGRLGPEADDPIDEFLAAALGYGRSHVPSLQGFLAWLDGSSTEIKRELDQGNGMVRIMTVHGSKGLQAPIVFLPDTVGAPTKAPLVLWGDGEGEPPLYAPTRAWEDDSAAASRAEACRKRDQEYRRLLYVALTRAEDRLYIAGWQGASKVPEGSWYRLVADIVAGLPGAVERPADFADLDPAGWPGAILTLAEPQTAPPAASRAAVMAGAAPDLPDWARRPPPAEPQPSRPLTPSRPDEPEPALRSPLGSDGGQRFRRGILIHRLLQTLPELPADARAAACRRYLARPAHGLDAAQQAAIADETLALMDDAAFRPLFGPGSRAEVPIVGRVGSRVLAGRIDRLVVTDAAVWIVDYKTNRPPPADPDAVAPIYLRQMATYRAALAAAYPGRRIVAVLGWTDGPRLMALPDRLLDAHLPEGAMAR